MHATSMHSRASFLLAISLKFRICLFLSCTAACTYYTLYFIYVIILFLKCQKKPPTLQPFTGI